MKKFVLSEMKSIKKREIPDSKKIISLKTKRGRDHFAVKNKLTDNINIIAEVKKSSPSAGAINETVSPEAQALLYMNSGAAAVSVLTEKNFFNGSLSDLEKVSSAVTIPVLCKDFIYFEEQIKAAYLCGADMILLIARALEDNELKELYKICLETGITPLIEVHHSLELDNVLELKPDMILVNMRNLETLEMDYSTGIETLIKIPADIKSISGSGINSAEDIKIIKNKAGTNTFLIGTSLMKNSDPGLFIQELENVC
jgi:indole-3-glycerol phosphate synthase